MDAAVAKIDGRLEHLRRSLREYAHATDSARHGSGVRRHLLAVDAERFDALTRECAAEGRTLLGADRLYVLWQAARNASPLGLPAVEVGAFRGGTAAFLARALRDAAGEPVELHVFDTFVGHVAGDVSPGIEPAHSPGRFSEARQADVRAFLSQFPAVHVHAEKFPEGAALLPPGPVGLVHLDVDLYLPTRATLELLTDRMPPGGIVVVDDFGAAKTPGVRQAVEEFLRASPPFGIWDVDSEQAVLIRR